MKGIRNFRLRQTRDEQPVGPVPRPYLPLVVFRAQRDKQGLRRLTLNDATCQLFLDQLNHENDTELTIEMVSIRSAFVIGRDTGYFVIEGRASYAGQAMVVCSLTEAILQQAEPSAELLDVDELTWLFPPGF